MLWGLKRYERVKIKKIDISNRILKEKFKMLVGAVIAKMIRREVNKRANPKSRFRQGNGKNDR